MVLRKSWFVWVQTHMCNFVVSGPKVYRTFCRTREESLLIIPLSDFRYVNPFRRYSRSKSEVVRNRAELCTILALSFCSEMGPQDLGRQVSKSTYSWSCCKVSRRSADGARRSRRQKKTSAVKHKTTGNCRSGRPNYRNICRTSTDILCGHPRRYWQQQQHRLFSRPRPDLAYFTANSQSNSAWAGIAVRTLNFYMLYILSLRRRRVLSISTSPQPTSATGRQTDRQWQLKSIAIPGVADAFSAA